jgi:hypothetical protein
MKVIKEYTIEKDGKFYTVRFKKQIIGKGIYDLEQAQKCIELNSKRNENENKTGS